MLGSVRLRCLDQPILVSLEALIPGDNFYRYLDRTLDLSFVRALVAETYADGGRPSIDPIVFFKLQLVMFFEGIRSERHLMRVVADRLGVRWYLGYNLDEPLPDHSSLTRIRNRYGLPIFRCFFEAIVEQCEEAGLVWGKELYFDATQVDANASLDSAEPRFFVEGHLKNLFNSQASEVQGISEGAKLEAVAEPTRSDLAGETVEASVETMGEAEPDKVDQGSRSLATPVPLPVAMSEETARELAQNNARRHDWIEREGRPDRTIIRANYQRRTDFVASPTDPDAALMRHKHGGSHFGYHDHYVVDGGKHRIILEVLATPADVMENQPMLDLLWRARFRWQLSPHQVTGDTTYGTVENIVAIENEGIRAYVPLPDFDSRTPFYGQRRFTYDAERDVYVCPQNQDLSFHKNKYTERVKVYLSSAATCGSCPAKSQCTESDNGRQVRRSFDEAYLQRVREYHATEAYQKAMGKRKVWVEPLFGEAKDWHGLRRFRLRGLWKVNIEALLIAGGQNLKRLLSKRGWGRRPWPSGAPGLPIRSFASQTSTFP